jgi:hypothetical protein
VLLLGFFWASRPPLLLLLLLGLAFLLLPDDFPFGCPLLPEPLLRLSGWLPQGLSLAAKTANATTKIRLCD